MNSFKPVKTYIQSSFQSNEDKSIESLMDDDYSKDDRIAIIGGHFMLIYDRNSDILVPAISDEIINPNLKDTANLLAGTFPLRSLQYSLLLHDSFREQNIFSKISIVVNDHIFQSIFDEALAKTKKKSSNLRKEYYKNNSIPKSLRSLLKNPNETLISNSQENRGNQEILPKHSYLFSEQVLRNRYKNKRKKSQSSLSEYSVQTEYSSYEGECDCSSEVIQLFVELEKLDFNKIVFFAPSDCFTDVSIGAKSFLELHSKTISRIKILGLENTPNEKPINIVEMKNG